MAENSNIEWTDHTFNPWMGCTKVSPACHNCYAERDMDHRYGKVKWGANGNRILTSAANWDKPVRWNRKAAELGYRPRVFCASLADVFEDWQGPITKSGVYLSKTGRASTGEANRMTLCDVRRDLFRLIDATPHLDWLLLTKRPENIERMWPCTRDTNGDGNCNVCVRASNAPCRHRKNVWLGTSIENQEWADKRLPHLIEAKQDGLVNTIFVSAEPLRGEVDLEYPEAINPPAMCCFGFECGCMALPTNPPLIHDIDWVITGGESGPGARPCNPDWFRSLRDQCLSSRTAFHFKQWGEFDENLQRVGKKNAGRLLDGITHDGLPNATPQP